MTADAEQETITARTCAGGFVTEVEAGGHRFVADEPTALGGTDRGPSPYDLLAAALGTCTSMTLRVYAERNGWPLHSATTEVRHRRVHAEDCVDCGPGGKLDQFEREIELVGPLDDTQRQRLLAIADRCPVHRTLHSEMRVITRLREPAGGD